MNKLRLDDILKAISKEGKQETSQKSNETIFIQSNEKSNKHALSAHKSETKIFSISQKKQLKNVKDVIEEKYMEHKKNMNINIKVNPISLEEKEQSINKMNDKEESKKAVRLNIISSRENQDQDDRDRLEAMLEPSEELSKKAEVIRAAKKKGKPQHVERKIIHPRRPRVELVKKAEVPLKSQIDYLGTGWVEEDRWADAMIHASEGLTAKAKAMRVSPLLLDNEIVDDKAVFILGDEKEIQNKIQNSLKKWIEKSDYETVKKYILSSLDQLHN